MPFCSLSVFFTLFPVFCVLLFLRGGGKNSTTYKSRVSRNDAPETTDLFECSRLMPRRMLIWSWWSLVGYLLVIHGWLAMIGYLWVFHGWLAMIGWLWVSMIRHFLIGYLWLVNIGYLLVIYDCRNTLTMQTSALIMQASAFVYSDWDKVYPFVASAGYLPSSDLMFTVEALRFHWSFTEATISAWVKMVTWESRCKRVTPGPVGSKVNSWTYPLNCHPQFWSHSFAGHKMP